MSLYGKTDFSISPDLDRMVRWCWLHLLTCPSSVSGNLHRRLILPLMQRASISSPLQVVSLPSCHGNWYQPLTSLQHLWNVADHMGQDGLTAEAYGQPVQRRLSYHCVAMETIQWLNMLNEWYMHSNKKPFLSLQLNTQHKIHVNRERFTGLNSTVFKSTAKVFHECLFTLYKLCIVKVF